MSPESRVVALSSALAAALGGLYLAFGPASQDLAAATFRADLFAEHGFALWNNNWYSGHYLLSYSVLYPPLGALLGAKLTAAASALAAAAVFAALAAGRFPAPADRRRVLCGSLWFAAAAAAWLLTGRVPFLLAVPFGLGALLAAERGRAPLGGALAALASLASPVGGLFTAIAAAAIWFGGDRRAGWWLALGAALPILALNLAFPVGGEEPFVLSAFVAVPLLALLVLWLVPPEQRALRIGVALYALLALAVFVIPNPLGGNVTRLGALFAGPVLLLALWPRGRLVVLAVSLPLLYWQLVAPVRDLAKAAGDPSTEAAFYAPLLAELDRLATVEGPLRIEIPPTKNRWEAAYVAERHPIARGWLRQLEAEDFDLFSDGSLTPEAYREWLERHAVGYVAVPDAARDYLAEDEVALIDSGLGYLERVWESEDWRLYRVAGAPGTGLAARGIERLGIDRFTLAADRPGAHPTAIRWSRGWRIESGAGCLREGADGETIVVSDAGERITVIQGPIGGSGC